MKNHDQCWSQQQKIVVENQNNIDESQAFHSEADKDTTEIESIDFNELRK